MKRKFIKIFTAILFFILVINGSFAQKQVFVYGYLYPVKIKDKWGYIDSTGKIIVEPKFHYATDFINGLGLVYMNADTIAFINTNGVIIKEAINPEMNRKYDHTLSEGLLAIFDPNTGKFGFINEPGIWKIPPKFDNVSDFSEGLAGVIENTSDKNLTFTYSDTVSENSSRFYYGQGYIDHSGNYVIEPKYHSTSGFYDGYAYADGNIIDKKENKIPFEKITKQALFRRFRFIDSLMYNYSGDKKIWVPSNEDNFTD